MDVERRFAATESRLADIVAQLPTLATKADGSNLEFTLAAFTLAGVSVATGIIIVVDRLAS